MIETIPTYLFKLDQLWVTLKDCLALSRFMVTNVSTYVNYLLELINVSHLALLEKIVAYHVNTNYLAGRK